VDAAVAEARKAIYFLPNDIEWGTPVLYMRSPDGVLFEMTQPVPPVLSTLKEVVLPPTPDESKDRMKRSTHVVSPVRPIPDEVVLLCTLKVSLEPVNTVALAPDQPLIATGAGSALWSSDNTVRLWTVPDGKLRRTLEGHKKGVYSVAFSPDGSLLASGAGGGFMTPDSTVRLWSVSDGKLLRTLEGHSSGVYSVAFSPDGSLLASGARDTTVRLWSIPDGALLRTLRRKRIF
jgi:WD40 repeat protein